MSQQHSFKILGANEPTSELANDDIAHDLIENKANSP